MLQFSVEDQVTGLLNEIERRMRLGGMSTDTSGQRLYDRQGLYMVRSVTRNVKEGGRPVKWKPSLRAAMQGGKTLYDTGQHILNPITYEVLGGRLFIGTNSKIAPAHNFGVTITGDLRFQLPGLKTRTRGKGGRFQTAKGKGPWVRVKSVTLPKREFMMFQIEDPRRLTKMADDHFTGVDVIRRIKL